MHRKPVKGMRALLTVAAMAGVAAVAACDGDNLFSVPGQAGETGAGGGAPTVVISVPRGDSISGTALGDSVFVSVRLTHGVGVRSVRLFGFSVRGDRNLGTEQIVQRFAEKKVELNAGVKDTTLSRYLVAIADTARERAFVVVEASDSAGNMAADTASLTVGGPKVELPGLKEGSVISSGSPLAATIKAADGKGVNQLRLEITGSLTLEVVKNLGSTVPSAQLDTSVAIPDNAAGPITVRGGARNSLGVVERTDPVRLIIADRKPPTAKILLPRGDSLSAKPLGDSVLVTARLTDNFGVRSVRMRGVAHRGSRELGTDTVVTRFIERAITFPAGVRDTTISRYLRATPDSLKESAWIRVVAADSSGNQFTDSVALVLGGPDVSILDIVDGQSVQAGLELTARVRAQDPLGITRVRILVTGAFQADVLKSISPSADSVGVDTIIPIPTNIAGPIQITALAWNSLDVAGQDGPLNMVVVPAGAGDTIRPVVKHSGTAPERMEIQDSVWIQISGSDVGGGVTRAGYTVLAISPSRGDTLVRTDSVLFDPPRTGTVTRSFSVPTFNVDTLSLPDTLIFEVHSWMRDAVGNCSASVGVDSLVTLACGTLPGGATVAQGRPGQRLTRTVVAGQTVRLPVGSTIMDAAVDTLRKRLYLSNLARNRVEVFDLAQELFLPAILVGSEPWGLAMSRSAVPFQDSLWVANSGGANLSVVDLNRRQEEHTSRFFTPDVLLFDVELRSGDSSIQYIVTPLPQAEPPGFSDRPQYVAVDSFGNIVYSTKTSLLGDLGTARKGFFQPGWSRSEAKLFVEHGQFAPKEDFWAIAHIDSISTAVDTLGVDSLGVATIAARMALFDHVPGFPNQVITGIARSDQAGAVTAAAAELITKGSDVRAYTSTSWNVNSITFKDTTYVASSGDGGWVGIGEGGIGPVGRVLMYRASPLASTALSGWTQVSNLLNNPSEEVRGLGLNYDGTLAVVRGRQAAYFITPEDLITVGQVPIAQSVLGSGATMHPLHTDAATTNNSFRPRQADAHLAFVASGTRTVDILDTWHFTRVGQVHIRDIITGPLRAVLPFPEDNAGYTCATIPVIDALEAPAAGTRTIGQAIRIFEDPRGIREVDDSITEDRCVVVKLFGTTSGGGVVMIDVRKGDVMREHPGRN